jgi:TP901 family phage tail tape measure protein
MPTTNFTKVINYIADTSGVVKELSKLQLINSRIASGLGKDFSQATQTMGEAVTGLTKSNLGDYMSKVSTNVTLADGRMGKFTETTKLMADGSEKVTTSFQEMDKSSQSLGGNIGKLLSRAALTIPIWLALRGAVMGTIGAFKNSLAGLIEYDKILQKFKKTLQGTPEEIARNFNSAKDTITKFSIETGKSTEDITKAIERFSTVGFDFETSMKAGLEATRLSIILFGDAEETANAFGRAMRVLVTDINDSAKSQEEISRAMALTSELFETNAFELKELNGGLEKFAGTAKSMGFTLEETITLLGALSTRGLNADRAGTLLRTTTQKLEQSLSKTAKVLGIQINPAVDRTFDVFMKVTNAIAKLKNEAGTISPAISEAIGELFGGVRGGEPIRDLIADMGNVNEAFNKFLSVRPDIGKFRQDVENINESLFRQVEIYHNLNKEAGKAFLTGFIGGNNFAESMKTVNSLLETAVQLAPRWGTILSAAFQVAAARPGDAIKSILQFTGNEESKVFNQFQNLAKIAIEGLKSGLSETQVNDAFKALADLRVNLTGINKDMVDDTFMKNLDRLEEAFIKISSTTKDTADNTENINKSLSTMNNSTTKVENSFVNQGKLSEVILKDVLERMKYAGALNSELTKTEIKLRNQWNIQSEWNDELARQLEYERQINEEKRLQSRLSSDTMKLFQIAQEQGIEVAREIGDVLAGNMSFDIFVRRGGEALDIFKKEWANLFEQQQALAFFKGDTVPENMELRGGTRIPIQENLGALNLTPAQIQRNRLERTTFLPPATTGALQNTFNQNNQITQNFNISQISSQEEFNEMAKKSFEDPNVKMKLAQLQTGNKQTQVF